MHALRAYRALPAATGAWFLVVALLGRLPSAMLQIGSLLLVSTSTGSLAAGGAAAACLALGQAVGGPVVGWLADTRGHRGIGLLTAALQVAAIVVLVLAAAADLPLPVVLLSAVAAGLTIPQVGPLARARWSGVVRAQHLPRGTFGTAMSYEGAADETTYVLGPALIGVLVALWSPSAAMLAAAALTAAFAVPFALHRTAQLVEHHALSEPEERPRDLPSIWILTVVMFFIGMFFASVQSGVTAFALAQGSEGIAGLVYGAMGVTSAIAGLLTALLPTTFPLARRLVVFPVVLLVFLTPLVLLGTSGSTSLPLLYVAVMLAGAAVAPTLITAFSLGERAVPISRLSWAMTVMASGVVLGYATSALLSGALAQEHGAIGAFLVTVAAVTAAVLVALGGYRRLHRLDLVVTRVPTSTAG